MTRPRGPTCAAPTPTNKGRSLNYADPYGNVKSNRPPLGNWDVDLGAVVRPAVVVTRETAIPVLANLVCVAVTSTLRGHPAEVELARTHGVREPSAANCDWLITVPKDRFVRRRGELDPLTARRLNAALVLSLGLDEP